MNAFKVILTLYKETPGTYHYRVPLKDGETATSFPASDLYIRKNHIAGRPPAAIQVTVEETR